MRPCHLSSFLYVSSLWFFICFQYLMVCNDYLISTCRTITSSSKTYLDINSLLGISHTSICVIQDINLCMYEYAAKSYSGLYKLQGSNMQLSTYWSAVVMTHFSKYSVWSFGIAFSWWIDNYLLLILFDIQLNVRDTDVNINSNLPAVVLKWHTLLSTRITTSKMTHFSR